MIDIAIISNAKTQALKAVTIQAVDTLSRSMTEPYALTVIESTPKITYENARIITPKPPFNYNGFGNLALRDGKNPYVGLFNNDVIFHPDWWTALYEAMRKNSLESASPWCNRSHPGMGIQFDSGTRVGYKIRANISGWAIVLTRDLYNRIGGFDTGSIFHYSDNRYADQIQAIGARHGLVTNSRVDHLESKTLKTMPDHVKDKFTQGDKKKYLNETKE